MSVPVSWNLSSYQHSPSSGTDEVETASSLLLSAFRHPNYHHHVERHHHSRQHTIIVRVTPSPPPTQNQHYHSRSRMSRLWGASTTASSNSEGEKNGAACLFATPSCLSSSSPNNDNSAARASYLCRMVGGAILLTSAIVWGVHNTGGIAYQSSQQREPSSSLRNWQVDDETQFFSEFESEADKRHEGQRGGAGWKEKPDCNDGYYATRTLKEAYSLPFVALFPDSKGQKQFEASSVVIQGDNVYAVCDKTWAISKFTTKLEPFAKANVQVGDPFRIEGEESGYQALFLDGGDMYVVRESLFPMEKNQTYHAVIEQLSLKENKEQGHDDYTVIETCSCEFEFQAESKGFQGAISVRDMNNELVVLGLCEGNFCSEEMRDERGNGRIIAMKRHFDKENGSCLWATVRMIDIPRSADFLDYSDMTMDATTGRIAITSQKDSQLWVGQMLGQDDSTGLWNVTEMEFNPDIGAVYDFPKNEHCETIYCNIEGVHWLSHDMILTVSNKMKSNGKQNFQCFNKDQSVHIFVLP